MYRIGPGGSERVRSRELPPPEEEESPIEQGAGLEAVYAEAAVEGPPHPQVVPPPPNYPEVYWAADAKPLFRYEPEPVIEGAEEPPPRTGLWADKEKRKRILLVVLIFVVLTALGGLVGGLVGHNLKRGAAADSGPEASSNETASMDGKGKSSSTRVTPGSGSHSATTASSSTATALPTSGPSSAKPSSPAVAATTSGSSNGANIQLFYQSPDSDGTKYRLRHGDSGQYSIEHDLTLTIPPRRGSLAVISRPNGSGSASNTTLLQLFYLFDSGADTHIVLAQVNCTPSPEFVNLAQVAVCLETDSSVISAKVSPVHKQSSLAALWLGGQYTVRVYYQAASGYLTELSGDPAEPTGFRTDWAMRRMDGAYAAQGSAIAAAVAPGPNINLFFAAAATGAPTVLAYSAAEQDWRAPSPIESTVSVLPPDWDSSAAIAACYRPTPKTYHFFYTVPESGQIVEYSRIGLSTGWSRAISSGSSESGSSSNGTSRPLVDAGMAAVGWSDQARLLYLSKGEMVESVLNNRTWEGSKLSHS